jgi:hypothetical protein
MGPEPELRAELDLPLPDSVWSGAATPFFVCGTAFSSRPVDAAELLIDDAPHPLDFQTPLARGEGVRFWATVPGASATEGRPVTVALRARWDGGETARAELGRIEVESHPEPIAAPAAAGPGLIAICLATFDPDLELLRRQLDSLRMQSDRNWVCVISDDCSDPERFAEIEAEVAGDGRFNVSRSTLRRGFYLNFERALRLAPAEAAYISLCDQDDVWYPDKLAVLRGAIGAAPLVYSDARLTDTEGTVLGGTLWPARPPNTASLPSVLVANSVAGASALIRADVARRALPFPQVPGWRFHDRWLPAVALAAGPLVSVDRPLYDYVQHGGGVLQGRFGTGPVPPESRADLTPSRFTRWRGRFFYSSVQLRMQALTLLDRDAVIDEADRRALRRLTNQTPSTALRLSLRSLRPLLRRNETSGLEWVAGSGLLWRSWAGLCARLGRGGGRCETAPPPLNLSDLAPPRWGGKG